MIDGIGSEPTRGRRDSHSCPRRGTTRTYPPVVFGVIAPALEPPTTPSDGAGSLDVSVWPTSNRQIPPTVCLCLSRSQPKLSDTVPNGRGYIVDSQGHCAPATNGRRSTTRFDSPPKAHRPSDRLGHEFEGLPLSRNASTPPPTTRDATKSAPPNGSSSPMRMGLIRFGGRVN